VVGRLSPRPRNPRQKGFVVQPQIRPSDVPDGAAREVAAGRNLHIVDFYDNDEVLCDHVEEFVQAGLVEGTPAVIIATPAHRQAFVERLSASGIDVEGARRRGQLTLLDARETLATFMVDAMPDPALFASSVGTIVERACRSGRVRAYGEMVDLLWREGNAQAAIRLEALWNELGAHHTFDLLCAYGMESFQAAGGQVSLKEICRSHSQVTPPRPAPGPQAPGESSPAGSVQLLIGEIAHRKQVEAQLLAQMEELRRSEEHARSLARRASQLQEATSAMGAALTAGDVSATFLAVTREVFGADEGVVYLRDQREPLFRQIDRQGAVESAGALDVHQASPVADAIRDGAPVWLEDQDELLDRYPAMAGAVGRTPQAIAALPLLYGASTIGGVSLTFDRPRRFDPEERAWLTRFAAQCALAAERARLYAAERAARSEAETLFRIADSLNSAQLDQESIVQRVADEASALVGARFGVFFHEVTEATGQAHARYALSGIRREDFVKLGLTRDTPLCAGTFAGGPIIRLADLKADPRCDEALAASWLTSYLAVPVVSRSGSLIGVMCFGHRDANRFTEQHERIVRTLAVSAAAALDNAQLFRTTREADARHRQLVDEMAETVRLNDLFTGVLAHDLRNPLTGIITSVRLAAMRSTDQQMTKPLARIGTSAERMMRLVEQLLDFARVRLGQSLPLTPRPTDLLPLVRHAIDELEGACETARVRVERVGDTAGVWDLDRLGQVFSNLIGNALQHGAGDEVHIVVDGSERNTVRFRIRNSGTIPPALLPKLFEPLGRADRARESSRGLGLGLFIAQQIATAHGGRLEVQSNQSEGTTFTLVLPRRTELRAEAQPGNVLAISEAKERAWQTEQRMRLLIDGIRDYGIFMLDTSGRVTTWNIGAQRLKGYTSGEIIGKHLSVFYTQPDRENGRPQALLAEAARQGRIEDLGWRVRKDGSLFWADVIITALKDSKGDLCGFAKVTRDLTERRKLEDERIRSARAEEAIRLRDEFLSMASHELKTPLTGLKMQLEALERRLDGRDERVAANLQRASDSSDRLAALVDSLLDVSRITAGSFQLAPQAFDLTEAVEAVAIGFRRRAAKAGCELRTRTPGPVIGRWDRLRTEHLLASLILNALTYGAGAPVDVVLATHGDEAWIEVRDHGPGIPTEKLAAVFSRFNRHASPRHYGGLGLGLYLVREIVRAHGGEVTAQNAPDGGAHFIVRLPLEPRPGAPMDATPKELQ
jgi:PAS domain S-box-containing protein